jgi:hypothetical protein
MRKGEIHWILEESSRNLFNWGVYLSTLVGRVFFGILTFVLFSLIPIASPFFFSQFFAINLFHPKQPPLNILILFLSK